MATAGINALQAARFREFGYDLAKARELQRRGISPEQEFFGQRQSLATRVARARRQQIPPALQQVPPHVQQSYVATQWLDDEAIAWAQRGVPADDAQLWRHLGLRPVEGGRLTRLGQTPSDVIRDWWRAGIPYDELAEWLGAGLTAEEAAAQRARGITVDQAAALRALRSSDDDAEPYPVTETQSPRPGDELKRQIHRLLAQRLGDKLYDGRVSQSEIETAVRTALIEVLQADGIPLRVPECARIAQEIADGILSNQRQA